MSEETIPISFTAKDQLSNAVKQMTEKLQKMGAVQDETTKAARDTTDALKVQGDQTQLSSAGWGAVSTKVAGAMAAFAMVSVAVVQLTEFVGVANQKWDEQSRKLGVSASSLGSIAEANAKAQKAQDKMIGSIGKAIEASGVFQTKAILQTKFMNALKEVIDENSKAIAEFGNKVAIWGAQKLQDLGTAISDNSETLARLHIFVQSVGEAFVLAGKGVMALVTVLKLALLKALSGATEGIAKLGDGLAYIIEAGGGTVPQALEDLRLGMRQVSKEADEGVAASWQRLEEQASEMEAATDSLGKKLSLVMTGTRSELASTEALYVSLGATVKQYGIDAEEALKKAQSGRPKARGDGEAGEDENIEGQKELLRLEQQIVESQILKNREKEIELRHTKAIAEAHFQAAQIKDEDLRAEQLRVDLLNAELERTSALADLEAQRAADRKAASDIEMAFRREQIARDEEEDLKAKERYDRAMANINERYNLETSRITEMGEALSNAFGNFPDIVDNVSASVQRMTSGFSKAMPQVANLANAFKAYNKQGASTAQQQDAINASISAGSGILSSVTSAFIEDKRKQAAIEALINAAAAAASYANGNIAAGIAFTSAAASYAAAAAFSGGGSGGGAVASGGGSGAGGSVTMPNVEDERRANAEAIAEAISTQRENQPMTINVSFDNALIAADSPQAARIISDMVIPELRNALA